MNRVVLFLFCLALVLKFINEVSIGCCWANSIRRIFFHSWSKNISISVKISIKLTYFYYNDMQCKSVSPSIWLGMMIYWNPHFYYYWSQGLEPCVDFGTNTTLKNVTSTVGIARRIFIHHSMRYNNFVLEEINRKTCENCNERR